MKGEQINRFGEVAVQAEAEMEAETEIPYLQVVQWRPVGRASFRGRLKPESIQVVLKPQKDWTDPRAVRWLHRLHMDGIPRVLGRTSRGQADYWVLDWIEGEPYGDVMVPPPQARARIDAVLGLLARLRRLTGFHWFHLDLKADHLLKQRSGIPAVIDFESCRLGRSAAGPDPLGRQPDKQAIGIRLLTPALADHAALKGTVSGFSDHYALAVIWLSWLCGRPAAKLDRRSVKQALQLCPAEDGARIRQALAGNGLILSRAEGCQAVQASAGPMLQSGKSASDSLNRADSCGMMTSKFTSEKGLDRTMDLERIERAVRDILIAVGEDPERPGLVETPARVARMYQEVFAGLDQDPRELLKVFHEPGNDEMILVGDIPFYSMCEHHLLPFIGKAHVVYIPRGGQIFGLSKIARIVDNLARKPQLQERLTSQIADLIEETIDPYGVCVVLEAEHLCMTMRGIKKPGSKTVTSALRGVCKTDVRSRAEAMALIGNMKS